MNRRLFCTTLSEFDLSCHAWAQWNGCWRGASDSGQEFPNISPWKSSMSFYSTSSMAYIWILKDVLCSNKKKKTYSHHLPLWPFCVKNNNYQKRLKMVYIFYENAFPENHDLGVAMIYWLSYRKITALKKNYTWGGGRNDFPHGAMNKEGLCFSLHMCSLKERIRLVFLYAPGTFFRRLPMFGFQTGAEERWSPDSAASFWNRLVQVEGVAGLFSCTQPPGCHTAVSPCLCTHMKAVPHYGIKKEKKCAVFQQQP